VHLVDELQRAACALHDGQITALRVAHDEFDLLELAAEEARNDRCEGDHRHDAVRGIPVEPCLARPIRIQGLMDYL
jgi:hypothetical protein